MEHNFKPIDSAEAWQLSNPPILPLASLRASMDIFDRVSMEELVNQGKKLNAYLEQGLKMYCSEGVEIITPKDEVACSLCG